MLRHGRRSPVAEDGFSLIELLVVLLIIGILAAIAIPAFLTQPDKAYDADAKAVVQTAQTAEEVAYTGSQTYVSQSAGAGPAGALSSIEPALSGPSAACVGSPPYSQTVCGLSATATGTTFQVSAVARTGVVFSVRRTAAGTVTRICDTSAALRADGCAGVVGGVGTW